MEGSVCQRHGAKDGHDHAKRRLFFRFTFSSNHFDLVHSQMMAGGIHSNRWRQYIADIFRVTRPGGWCQMVEVYFNAQSDNGTLTHGMWRPAAPAHPAGVIKS